MRLLLVSIAIKVILPMSAHTRVRTSPKVRAMPSQLAREKGKSDKGTDKGKKGGRQDKGKPKGKRATEFQQQPESEVGSEWVEPELRTEDDYPSCVHPRTSRSRFSFVKAWMVRIHCYCGLL